MVHKMKPLKHNETSPSGRAIGQSKKMQKYYLTVLVLNFEHSGNWTSRGKGPLDFRPVDFTENVYKNFGGRCSAHWTRTCCLLSYPPIHVNLRQRRIICLVSPWNSSTQLFVLSYRRYSDSNFVSNSCFRSCALNSNFIGSFEAVS